LKLEDIQDDERDALTPDQLSAIAKRFISSSSQTAQEKVTSPPPKAPEPVKKKSGTGKAIIIIVISLIVVSAGLIVFSSISNSDDYGSGESYQERVMTIEEMELSEPTNFLSADGTYSENFWGDKINVTCVITNKATVATFKDAVIRITYYTKTKTELGSKEYSVYEVFAPNSKKTVELKIDNFKDVHTIGWEVISASPY
jgi:hypothetical protein